MAKITQAEARKKMTKEVTEPCNEAWDRIGKSIPKVKQLTTKLDAELKKAESREMIDTLGKALKLQMRTTAEDVVVLHNGLKRLKEMTDDEDFLEALGPEDLAEGMKEATDRLEAGRNAVRDAKTAMDSAEEFLKNQRVDPDAAGEDWATAYTNLERLSTAAIKESPAWLTWQKDAQAAVDGRNAAALDKLRKARPPAKNMDIVAGLDAKNPFAGFDKTYTVSELPESLRKEIAADRTKYGALFEKARLLALEKDAIVAEVDGLSIAVRDGEKALKTLGFPKAAQAKLQAALDGSDDALPKALEALAKTHKVEDAGSGRDMVGALKKAKVL